MSLNMISNLMQFYVTTAINKHISQKYISYQNRQFVICLSRTVLINSYITLKHVFCFVGIYNEHALIFTLPHSCVPVHVIVEYVSKACSLSFVVIELNINKFILLWVEICTYLCIQFLLQNLFKRFVMHGICCNILGKLKTYLLQ